MHVIFGATGKVGGQTAQTLIDAGKPVRVVVRNPEQAAPWTALGAEHVVASIEDTDAVTAALSGASSAFLLNPPPMIQDPFVEAELRAASLAEAMYRSGLPKAVILSSIGAQHRTGTGIIATLHQFEMALHDALPAVAFLRPGYFIESWEDVLASVTSDHSLPTFIEAGQKIPMVSTTDVGQTAGQLMLENWAGRRIVELDGPEEVNPRDVASAFASALGHSVEPAFIPLNQQQALLEQAGLSPEVASALVGMYEGIANGRVDRQDGTEHLRGRTSLKTAITRMVQNSHEMA